jgi:hypothetical protein
LSIIAFAALPIPSGAMVTFGFYETGCIGGACEHNPLPLLPELAMSLTISNPTGSGSAIYLGPIFSGGPGLPPVVTDPNFEFEIPTHVDIGAPTFGADDPTVTIKTTTSVGTQRPESWSASPLIF